MALVLFPTKYTYAPTAQAQQKNTPTINASQGEYNHPVQPPKEVLPSYLTNCWEYVRISYPNLPTAREVVASTSPAFGEIAVFYYSNGLHHFAIVTGQGAGVFYIRESNYESGSITTRTISFSDPNLLGFYRQ